MQCKNCNRPLQTEQNYCFHCGAKVIRNRLTARNLSSDFSEQFLSYDNKFLKTFVDLFKSPEAVIDGYIKGTRKKYINVVQYLAISITLLGLQYFIINSINPEFFMPKPNTIDAELAKLYPKEVLDSLDDLSKKMNEHMSLVYIIGLPFSAVITWIVFLKEKQHNFTEHLVINMYVTAQYIICAVFFYLAFFALKFEITSLLFLLTVLYIIYFGYAFYRLYALKVGTVILRFFYSIIVFVALSIPITIVGGLITVAVIKLLN